MIFMKSVEWPEWKCCQSTAGGLGNKLVSLSLVGRPQNFYTRVCCLTSSFPVPQRSTRTHGLSCRLKNWSVGGGCRQFRISLEMSAHYIVSHGAKFLPGLDEQVIDDWVVLFSYSFFVQSLDTVLTASDGRSAYTPIWFLLLSFLVMILL